MTRRSKRLRAIKPLTPELQSDPIIKVETKCVACSKLTGKTMEVRKSEMEEGQEKAEVYDGTCPECTKLLDSGHAIFVGTDGAAIFRPEAVGENYRGKVINVDCAKQAVLDAFEEVRKKKL